MDAYGPNTAEVERFIAMLKRLSVDQERAVVRAIRWERSSLTSEALDALDDAGMDPECSAAGYAVRTSGIARELTPDERFYYLNAACSVASALVVRDLIPDEYFRQAVAEMRAAGLGFDRVP